MVRESSREKYIGVSLPVGLMLEVDKYIMEHPRLAYKSRAEFIKESIRSNLR